MTNVQAYSSLIAPERLLAVANLTDATIADVSTAGEVVEKAYGRRGELIRAITQLDGTIQLTEAEAFMKIDEKNVVEVDGKPVKLANSEMRDMYRRYVTRDLRKQLHEKQAELKEIEVNVFKAKERYDEAKVVADMVIAKSSVQANLLKFLAGRD